MSKREMDKLRKMQKGDQINWADPKTKKETNFEISSVRFYKKIAVIKGKEVGGTKNMKLKVELDSVRLAIVPACRSGRAAKATRTV